MLLPNDDEEGFEGMEDYDVTMPDDSCPCHDNIDEEEWQDYEMYEDDE